MLCLVLSDEPRTSQRRTLWPSVSHFARRLHFTLATELHLTAETDFGRQCLSRRSKRQGPGRLDRGLYHSDSEHINAVCRSLLDMERDMRSIAGLSGVFPAGEKGYTAAGVCRSYKE